jgi:predicted nuclease of predicted toxin-antitoxin system
VRFFTDHDVYAATIRLLRGLGHDVLTASQAGLATAEDIELLSFAAAEKRILVTRDRDYGALVFRDKAVGGVIYLRLSPSTQEAAHARLAEVLKAHSEDALQGAFVTVEPERYRFRVTARA